MDEQEKSDALIRKEREQEQRPTWLAEQVQLLAIEDGFAD